MYIDHTVYTGRPADRRADKEERCYALLDSLGVAYTRVDHDHADTIEACHEIEKLLGCEICKNLFLTNRQMTELWLLLMPGDKPFKTKLLSKQIGSARLSFATPEQMLDVLDITPGSVSVLGLINDRENRVRLLIDRDPSACTPVSTARPCASAPRICWKRSSPPWATRRPSSTCPGKRNDRKHPGESTAPRGSPERRA